MLFCPTVKSSSFVLVSMIRWASQSNSGMNRAVMGKKSNNFDAYYLPDEKKDLLSEPRTPVNTFRIIFNSYFNGEYDLLENSSYYSNPFDKIYQFKDVTDVLIVEN